MKSTRFSLSNGLTVVFEENPVAPVAAFQVWVKVGSADELPSEVGLAHLHEHMLFKGTAKRGPGEIARSVEAHGGEINAWTSFDQTVYHVVMASRFAREGLDVLADAVRSSAFDADELQREIEVVCEEIKRSLDMPGRRASKDLFAQVYPSHPYGRPVIGFEPNVRAHTRDGVTAFYKKHYRPSNMVLAAAGDFTEAQLRQWAEELFGGEWDRPENKLPSRAQDVPLQGVRVQLKEDEVKEAIVHLAFPIPGAAHPDSAVLDVLAMIAGQGDGSRLGLTVKRRLALANDASAWAYTPVDPGIFAASVHASQATVAQAFSATLETLQQLKDFEVEPAELSTVQTLMESEAIYQRETVQGLARKLGYYEAAAGGVEREAEYYARILAVTPQSLRAAAQKYVNFETAVVTALMPKGTPLTEESVRAMLKDVQTKTVAAFTGAQATRLPPTQVAPKTQKTSAAIVRQLPSGTTLVIKPEAGVPTFAVRATWRGGLMLETEENNGLHALIARTLTKGTTPHTGEQISHLVDAMSGSLSAIAGRSSFSVRGEFLSRHFERAFELFAEAVQQPAFRDEDVAREKKRMLDDIHSRDDRPSSLAFELFTRTLYKVHPYRLATLGEKASVELLTAEMLRAHVARLFSPNGMTLTLVGDLDVDEVVRVATAAFGKPGTTEPLRPGSFPEVPWHGPREAKRVIQKAQTHLVLGFPGARITDGFRRPLEVLTTLLSGQSGRLFLELRDKQSLAYSVSAMSVEGVDPGYFAVYMATSPEKVPQALEGIRLQLRRLVEENVSEAELSRAREHLIGSQAIGLQRNGARASTIALDMAYGLGPDAYLRYPDEIAAVTAEQVREVAKQVINFEKSALAVVGA